MEGTPLTGAHSPEPARAVKECRPRRRALRAAGAATVALCVGASLMRTGARSTPPVDASELVSIFEWCVRRDSTRLHAPAPDSLHPHVAAPPLRYPPSADFDDDGTYTNSTCKGFDRAACNVHCTSGWCLELCGDSCMSGAGALCAATFLSDITSLCETVSWKHTPKRSLASRYPYGRGSDNDYAEGCDHHLYCSFCNPTCQNLLNEYPEGEFVAFTNVGPHAMRLLSNLTEICTSITYEQPRPEAPPGPHAAPKPHAVSP